MGESTPIQEVRDCDVPSQALNVPDNRTSHVRPKQVCKPARAKIYGVIAAVILGTEDGSDTSAARASLRK